MDSSQRALQTIGKFFPNLELPTNYLPQEKKLPWIR